MTRARKKVNASTGNIRIIGGEHRGRKLPVLNLEGLRPTTDRMKETVFNWLMLDVRNANCIDCFAGAGSLGFEALSRGAAHVHFIELDKPAAQQLVKNLSLLRIDPQNATVKQGNALHVLETLNDSVDLVFIDPPFHKNLVQSCIDILQSKHLVKVGSKIYIERENDSQVPQIPDNWQQIKDKSTQQVSAVLYQVV
jgi:16S rRNA (guanine966-N2)-methyltransferase